MNYGIKHFRFMASMDTDAEGGNGCSVDDIRCSSDNADNGDNKDAAQMNGQQFDSSLTEFSYNGKKISEIAKIWQGVHGTPSNGEAMSYYKRMCMNLRYICNNMPMILVAQLPEFGLPQDARFKIASDSCKYVLQGKLPTELYTFLVKNGLKEQPKHKELTIPNFNEDDSDNTPKFPAVFDIFKSISPEDYWLPQTYAVEACLGTLFTGLKAAYLDGSENTCTCHNVIYAPPSCGKSFARRTVDMLTNHLTERDMKVEALERAYMDRIKAIKATRTKIKKEDMPEEPHYPRRMMAGVTSVTKLLERQYYSQGMHQLCFDEEIDTFNGGRQKMELGVIQRKNWDNAVYSQDYKSDMSFSGSVHLYINYLQLGTPRQLRRLYRDPEDGLISRVGFCRVKNQEYAPMPIFGNPTPQQLEYLQKVKEFADSLTYADEDFMIAKERTDITDDMQFMVKPIADWLEEKRKLSGNEKNFAMDVFRKREGVKMWRLAMCCWGAYLGELNEKRKQIIKDFVIWRQENDLQNILELYGKEMQESATEINIPFASVYARLKDEFTLKDVEQIANELEINSPVRHICYTLKKRGFIEKTSPKRNSKFRKIIKQ